MTLVMEKTGKDVVIKRNKSIINIATDKKMNFTHCDLKVFFRKNITRSLPAKNDNNATVALFFQPVYTRLFHIFSVEMVKKIKKNIDFLIIDVSIFYIFIFYLTLKNFLILWRKYGIIKLEIIWQVSGLRIEEHPVLTFERGEKISFFFNGKEIEAYPNETIAAALHAAGIHKLGESPKLHRPRGLFCAIGNCSSCFMIVDDSPNTRVCVVKVKPGMQVRSNDK